MSCSDAEMPAEPSATAVSLTVTGSDDSSVFPLPLTDFEYYMFADDRQSHPMVFVMTILVQGSLQHNPFHESLQELLRSQPLIRCRIAKTPDKNWCWVPLDEIPDVLEWSLCPAPDDFIPEVRSLDITQGPGIRVVAAVADQRSRIVLYLHHACCDGIGALQLIGELFARYGQKTCGPGVKAPQFEPVSFQQLKFRDEYEAEDRSAPRRKRSLSRIVGKIARLLLRRPVRIAGSSDNLQRTVPPIDKRSVGAIQSRLLSPVIHRHLRAASARESVSLNDFLLREMISHIRDWNRHCTPGTGRNWIRIAVPLSMRTPRHSGLPAANVVSYALVTRRECDCDHPEQLLKSIHEQTSDVLFNREGLICLKLFRVLRRIPLGMSFFLKAKSVLSTMVFANVGDVRRRFSGRFPLDRGRWVAGNVIIDQIHGVAPVRPGTHAAMSIGDYAGELSLSLRTDATVFTALDSQRFLEEFLRRLTRDLPELHEEPDPTDLV